jgi:hypothetical protein
VYGEAAAGATGRGVAALDRSLPSAVIGVDVFVTLAASERTKGPLIDA